MLQLPFPARQRAEPFSPSAGSTARRLKVEAHRRFEGTLWRTASLGLVASLTLFPRRFEASSLAIGNAYKFRFWRPAVSKS